MVAPQNFEPNENFVVENFYTCHHWAVTKYQKALCVCGYHVYEDIWEMKPYIYAEKVDCLLEPGNFHDKIAIAVEKDGIIIGYLPRNVLCIRDLLLKTGGTIRCPVTGRR